MEDIGYDTVGDRVSLANKSFIHMIITSELHGTLMLNASFTVWRPGRNNEKDIYTLVLKRGLVTILAPCIRQTWPYLKINQIRLTNRLKAKHL